MEALINSARNMNLEKMSMSTALWIMIPIVFIMYVSYKGTLFQFSVKILTKERLTFGKVLIPTILSCISGTIFLGIAYILLKSLDINIKDLGVNILFKFDVDVSQTMIVILAVFVSQVLNMAVTASFLQLKNFDIYVAIGKGFRVLLKKVKKEDKDISSEVLTKQDIERTKMGETQRIDIDELNPYENTKLGYVNGLLCSLFTMAITFFLAVVFVFIGEYVGKLFLKLKK